MFVRESVMIDGRPLTFETGRLAKQAHGSVLISFGESSVLVTVVSSSERPGLDFFPLTCEYVEKTYAAGKIPGGFFKREGRLRDYEILASRLMDRPLRPLFPKGYKKDTQVIATVLSADKVNPTDVLALTGASAALSISDVPWAGPIVGIRVARIDGQFSAYPTFAQSEMADIDLVVACSKDAIIMVEGGADEASESEIIDALMFAHEQSQPIIELIEKMQAAVGKPKREFSVPTLDEGIARRVAELADGKLREACVIKDKHARYDAYAAIKTEVVETLTRELGEEQWAEVEKLVKAEIEHRKAEVVRGMVLDTGKRIDGRDTKTVRPITCEVGLLARTHGSALFQRGETQAIVTATLGTASDEQKIDALTGESWKQFMLHYNFPPFSTGETKPMRGPGRREIGHGALAERALVRMVPKHDKFPYTIRVVSEVLESNGSSSMASVCGGTLALMDTGVPLRRPVAGIAMGLISEGERVAILSDILGDEDHLGDMDFKVCGTDKGITAIQMDIKIAGLERRVLEEALAQARDGRLHILDRMLETLREPRAEISKWAPRITTMKVKPDQIRVIIGPGGKTIKGITEQTGCDVNVEDDGTVSVAGVDPDAVKRALAIIEGLTAEPEVGKVYKGTIKRIVDFGAFVEILPNNEALLHVSEIAYERVEHPSDVLEEGQEIEVKCISVERDGKTRLSRKELLPVPEGYVPRPPRSSEGGGRGEGGGRREGGRGRPGGGRDRGERRPRRD
ncbi:MAG: polyribonucleotide nucleotidyltransferase [Myxococcales bacterium]|jgi:polyribonucleotide nucleotidyltransferase|nr:polyribonucleotide nucleotidyltransferase [Myxococcales bacterium]